MTRIIVVVLAALLGAAAMFFALAQKEPPPDMAALEKQFEESLTGATLVGNFTMGESAALREEKYAIEKVSKVKDGLWLFQARIQYGKRDVTVPLPLPVQWAGDTPVITLTDMTIPGLGTYTARVMFYRGQYAGTWSGKGGGGHLFGRIVKESAPAAAPR